MLGEKMDMKLEVDMLPPAVFHLMKHHHCGRSAVRFLRMSATCWRRATTSSSAFLRLTHFLLSLTA